jgi:hypothetical protein
VQDGLDRTLSTILLLWTYSHKDYFEEAIDVSSDGFVTVIVNGTVEAKIDSSVYAINPSLDQVLHGWLNSIFLGAQLISHRSFTLHGPQIIRLQLDGRREFILKAESGRFEMSGGTAYLKLGR